MNKLPLILLSLILVGCGGSSSSDNSVAPIATCSAVLTWEPPYDRIDGTPITTEELEKFTIYVNRRESVEETTLVAVIDITDTNIITWRVDNLPKGQKYFYMTVTDTDGRTSTFSNILNKLC